jgi:hypothetical protein
VVQIATPRYTLLQVGYGKMHRLLQVLQLGPVYSPMRPFPNCGPYPIAEQVTVIVPGVDLPAYIDQAVGDVHSTGSV